MRFIADAAFGGLPAVEMTIRQMFSRGEGDRSLSVVEVPPSPPRPYE